MAALIIAGHETTAYTLCWILYELARYPEHQNMIVQEAARVRSQKLNNENEDSEVQKQYLTANEYDSMEFLNAAIKVGFC
ncbi:hypothetical protein VKT23_016755 [Stygiomarasmius scandens]|uniref:Cytochrome P450 n=1 Tax=Marasmiellus scandens TaxID=2682957 RepID=A0ABR1IU21_9AGAR